MNGSQVLGVTMRFQLWRLCAWAGPLFIVGLLVFWGLVAGYVPPPPQYWSAQEVADFFARNNLGIRTGMVGVAFIAPFYFVWSSVISRLMQRIEGPEGVLSNIELMGGVCTAIVTQGFAVMWLAASFRTAERSIQDLQLLMDLGWFIFNSTFMVTSLQMIALGLAIILDPRAAPLFPRWLGWCSCAVPTTFLPVLLMPFFMHGPFPWHGLLTYWVGLSAYFLWSVPACYFVLAAVGKVEREAAAA